MRTILTIMVTAGLSIAVGSAADVKAGQATYVKACKACHGADGAGNPAVGKMMKVELRDLKSADVQAMSDADLKKIVTHGKGKMKPVSAVSADAQDDLIAYLRSLKK